VPLEISNHGSKEKQMQIEVLNGEDGKTVVRGINPNDGGAEFAGSILEPGQRVAVTLPDVHEAAGVQFGEITSIQQEAPAEQPEGGAPEQPAEAPAEGGQDVPGEPPVGNEGAAPESGEPAGEPAE
jgi:hypothetical protein